ncbi:MAG: T9SS type A sorting domain-containing protein, partial [Bacteroidia bacterium]|nr:T9SS type A sorting domain-containing protein [Bacteroidia bacterium]
STDPNSGLTQYWYSVGTAPGSTNIIAWTNAWANTLITTNIPGISHGTIYYFNVKAENGAGLFSPVVSSNGQMVDTTCINTGIALLSNNSLLIYPNPAKDQVQIISVHHFNLEIYDALGALVYSDMEYKRKMNIDISKWPDGVYLIKIKNADGTTQVSKIIKQ